MDGRVRIKPGTEELFFFEVCMSLTSFTCQSVWEFNEEIGNFSYKDEQFQPAKKVLFKDER